jgi:Uma2 family endonuclease
MAAPITDINQLDPQKTYTYADYLQWRFDEYVELFRGKLMRKSPAPMRRHQKISGKIFLAIGKYLEHRRCEVYHAPFDVRLPQKGNTSDKAVFTVVQPDICIICDESKLDERGCIGAPDTIIEILSSGNVDRDLKKKFDLYEEHGVPEYWIVAPGIKNVTVYTMNESSKYELKGEFDGNGPIPLQSLPGFSLMWEDIFEE